MHTAIRNLEPKDMWSRFLDLNQVPRASKKEEKVIQFMLDFGNELQLPTFKDHIGNVIIKKPASPGMENRKTIVLQSHLDMVHQKNNDTQFDFATEGIKMYIDGDWVKAYGTTLGADNGIGVASIMAILASKEIVHPPIEALFTIDEETGMTGALELKGGLLDGNILLNLDTEDDDELTIGCAGGIDVTATGVYDLVPIEGDMVGYEITVKGLAGGHSGMDIHKGLGNANKLMNRILYTLSDTIKIQICSVDGGSLRNAIPRESTAKLAIAKSDSKKLHQLFTSIQSEILAEYKTTDPNAIISLNEATLDSKVLNYAFQSKIIKAIYACPSGIYRMSPDVDDLVQTSNNLARVLIKDGKYQVLCLTRSSVDSEKMDLAQAIKSTFELIDGAVTLSGNYPGWTPKPDASIVRLMQATYSEMFGSQAHVYACHAGLECGILGSNYPNMEMISFGPNIKGAHSPDERVQISSVQKYWSFLLETLKRIPVG